MLLGGQHLAVHGHPEGQPLALQPPQHVRQQHRQRAGQRERRFAGPGTGVVAAQAALGLLVDGPVLAHALEHGLVIAQQRAQRPQGPQQLALAHLDGTGIGVHRSHGSQSVSALPGSALGHAIRPEPVAVWRDDAVRNRSSSYTPKARSGFPESPSTPFGHGCRWAGGRRAGCRGALAAAVSPPR